MESDNIPSSFGMIIGAIIIGVFIFAGLLVSAFIIGLFTLPPA